MPSFGPRKARTVCVGEAPGVQETIYGRPFIGNSGRLLKEVLRHSGIKNDETFYTNVVLCRPERNSDPSKEAIAACSQRLHNEITGRQPETIVALGNFAAKALLRTSDGIMRLRVGPPKTHEAFPNVQIIPTIHPAAALRAADYFPFIVTDVGKVAYGPRGWSPPEYAVADTGNAAGYIERLVGRDPFTIDIEVAVEKDLSFEHPAKYRLLCVGIADNVGSTVVFPGEILDNLTHRTAIGALLSQARIICHNGKFDIPGIRQFAPGARLWFDTLLAHYCLDERRGIHGLKFISREYLAAPDYAAEIKKYIQRGHGFDNIPSDVLFRYNAYDVALTYQLYRIFRRRLANTGLSVLHEFLVEASNALMQVETEGVMVDVDYLESLDRNFSARLDTQDAQLQQWVANPRSPKQITEALKSFGVTTTSTDVPHLQAIVKSIDKYLSMEASGEARERAIQVKDFITALLTYRKDQKLFGTYIRGVQKRLHKGRIHASYLIHGTTTGRLSCRNPNVQNIPRGSEIRKLFVAANENCFVQADFKQGELRVIATLSGDQYLTSVFAEGRDLLNEIAARFYGPNFTKEQRVKAKNICYGSMYGMEALKLTTYANVSVQEARVFQRELFNLMPSVRLWQETTRSHVLAGNDLVTAFGRRRRYMLITDENRKDIEKECLAFVPQSTLSDICLASLIRLVDLGFSPRLTVHDSILCESRLDRLDETTGALNVILPRIAAERFSNRVPFPVELQIGRSWGEVTEAT